MTTTEKHRYRDILTRRDTDLMDEPVRAEKWVNIHFLKSGQSFRGECTFASQDAAAKAVDESLAELSRCFTGKEHCAMIMRAGQWIGHTWDEYSHAIQMPVKE